MAKYAKFISEDCIKYAPRTLKEQDFICFNFDKASPEILNSRGYYEVVETNKPEDIADETHYAKPTYRLVEDIHTETKVTPVTVINETTGEEYEDTVAEDVTIDNSYIECTYVAEELAEEQE